MRGALLYAIGWFTILLIVVLFFTGCATPQPVTSKDTMLVCKQLCRGSVGRYVDDSIECQCKGGN